MKLLYVLLLLATSTCLPTTPSYEHPRTAGYVPPSTTPKAPENFGVKPKIVGGDYNQVFLAKQAEKRFHQIALMELQQLLSNKGELPSNQLSLNLPAGTTSTDLSRARYLVEQSLIPRTFNSAVEPTPTKFFDDVQAVPAMDHSDFPRFSSLQLDSQSQMDHQMGQKTHLGKHFKQQSSTQSTTTEQIFSKLEAVLKQFDKRQDLLEHTVQDLTEEVETQKKALLLQKKQEAEHIKQAQDETLETAMETMSAVLSGNKKKANALFLQIQEKTSRKTELPAARFHRRRKYMKLPLPGNEIPLPRYKTSLPNYETPRNVPHSHSLSNQKHRVSMLQRAEKHHKHHRHHKKHHKHHHVVLKPVQDEQDGELNPDQDEQ